VSKIEYKQSITKRLILYIVLFSSFVTLLLTINQLYMEYVAGMNQVKGQMNQIKTFSLPALTENVWNLYEKQIKMQLNELIQHSDLRYLEIRSKGQVVAVAGTRTSKNTISQTFPMIYTREDEKIPLGELLIIASLEGIYQELLDKTLIILISNTIKVFFVSIFMFFIFQHFVIKHLRKISQHLQRITPDNLDTLLTLKRRINKDELQQVVTTINEMGVTLSKTTVSKEYVDSIIISMAESLIVINPNTTIKTVNKATLNLLGYDEQELLGKPIGIIFEEDQEIFRETEIDKLIKKSCATKIETIYLTKEGRKVPVLFSGSVMRDKEGGIHGIICVASDISGRKKAENQIKASLKEKEVLLQEIHHRVKNNMQIISSLLKLQASIANDERVTDALKESQSRVYAMASVHEILYGSDSLTSIEIRSYISKLAKTIFQSYGASMERIDLKVEIEDIKLGIEQAIPLGLLINELVSNSLKYAFPGNCAGQIIIKLQAVDQGEIECIVCDNGEGIQENIDWRSTDTLGFRLVKILGENQLNGITNLGRDNGTHFSVRFKLKESL